MAYEKAMTTKEFKATASQRISKFKQEWYSLDDNSNGVHEGNLVNKTEYSKQDRYSDIKTYEYSRVKLQERQGKSTYINACLLDSPFKFGD